jgi:hypothetical protein
MRAWPSVLVLVLIIPWRAPRAAATPAWSDTTALDAAFAELTALATPLLARRPIDCATYRRDLAPRIRAIPQHLAAIDAAHRRVLDDVTSDWRAAHEPALIRYVLAVEHPRRDKSCRAIRDDDAAQQTARWILALANRLPIEPTPSLHCGDFTLVGSSLWDPPSPLGTLADEVRHEAVRRVAPTSCLEPIKRSVMGEL